jgi:phage shock protein PspC (stress-responsive transcriptional regulator)
VGQTVQIAPTLMNYISTTMVVMKLFYFILLFVITSIVWEKEEVVESDMFS